MYPSKILPNPNYKLITCDVSNHAIVRYTTAVNKDDIIEPETQKVKVDCISSPREGMADLSTSFLGVFQLENLRITLTDEGKNVYNEYCEPNLLVEAPVIDTHYSEIERGYWWIIIKDINQEKVDFVFDNKTYKAQCRVEHTPMKWNYWHYSVRWYIEGVGYWHLMEDMKLKAKFGKKLGHEARTYVKMFAKVDEPNITDLSEEFYKIQA